VRLEGDDLVRPLGIIHARGKQLPPTAARFIDLLRGHAHDVDEPAEPIIAHA
jgi:hypothetical protein